MKRSGNVAVRVSVITIIINLILSLFKFLAGIIGKSSAMLSDAVHSASDVFSTLVVIAGVKMAEKEEDEAHPYGHERMECVAAILLAVLLALVGIGIGVEGLKTILAGSYETLAVPGMIALVAAVLSIVVKEWMFWYARAAAKKTNSAALMADAWHHRSDALSSVGSFVGILFARIGFPVMDAVAGVIISGCILKAAYDVFKDGLDKMVDHSCDIQTEEEIRQLTLAVAGVKGIDDLKTRLFGAKLYVDMEISADGNLTLTDAHWIAEQVHDAVEETFPHCKHCMVHVNPAAE
ncbi:MAG: cation transporter [Clostridia bacterium]|nr:cation transporter [Clostridia bacterium]